MNKQKIYDIVESLLAESDYKTIVDDDYILSITEELEEDIDDEEYSTLEIKNLVRDKVDDIQSYTIDKFEITEDELKDFIVVADELGYDLKYILENKDDIYIYKMDLNEFVEMLIMEYQIFGEVSEEVLYYIDYEHVWNSLLRFDFVDTSVGYVDSNI